MKLAKTPLIPKELAWVTVAAGSVPDLWKPYLAQ
jgi:hypothetical protein